MTAMTAKSTKTYWMPTPATMKPTRTGPREDPARSQAEPNPVPMARSRVG